MKDRPIFILGCTKSGTTLMRNLFEGHPDLFIVPFESHYFQITKHWVSYYHRRTQPQILTFDEKKLELFKWMSKMNTIKNHLADGFIHGSLNLKLVEELFEETKVNSERELFDLYINAIQLGIFRGKGMVDVNFVEKSVENAEFVQEILRIYPRARFVHILRNPYSNLVAIRKYAAIQQGIGMKKFPRLKSSLQSMYTSYYFLYKNKKMIDNYLVVRYEDLLNRPEQTMRNLSNALGIEFNRVMLTPTFLGEVWKGNSSSGRSYSSVSNAKVDSWKNEISALETTFINDLFDFIVDDFGYERVPSKRWSMRPAPGESVFNFIYNRLIKTFLPNWIK